MLNRTVAFGSFAFAALTLSTAANAQTSQGQTETSPAASAATAPVAPAPVAPAPVVANANAPSAAPVALPRSDVDPLAKRPPQYGTESIGTSEEGRRARAILEVLASRERTARLTGAYTGFVLGAATLGVSTAVELQSDRSIGAWPWIIGGSFVLSGVTGLLTRGPLESVAENAGSQSDAALRDTWQATANSARNTRIFGAWMNTGLGAVAIATGTAVAAGAVDMDRDHRVGWSVGLLAGGGALATAGVIGHFVKTDAEKGFQEAYGGESHALSVGVAPLPGGGAISLSGKF